VGAGNLGLEHSIPSNRKSATSEEDDDPYIWNINREGRRVKGGGEGICAFFTLKTHAFLFSSSQLLRVAYSLPHPYSSYGSR
jgi:hypothetical protein